MKKAVFLLAALFLISGSVMAQVSIGSAVNNFSLADTTGVSRDLNTLKGKNGAVLVFLSAQCPVVKAYSSRIAKMADDYAAKGISVIGINSNASESLEYIKAEADKAGFKFPILIDKGNKVADALDANVTPEIFYLDAGNNLLYRGAIDNDKSGKGITIHYLGDAVDQTLAGKKVQRAFAVAFGCSIKRVGE